MRYKRDEVYSHIIHKNNMCYVPAKYIKESDELSDLLYKHGLDSEYDDNIQLYPLSILNYLYGLSKVYVDIYKEGELYYILNDSEIYIPIEINSHNILLNEIVEDYIKDEDINMIEIKDSDKYILELSQESKLTSLISFYKICKKYKISYIMNIKNILEKHTCLRGRYNDLYNILSVEGNSITTTTYNRDETTYNSHGNELFVVDKLNTTDTRRLEKFIKNNFIQTKTRNVDSDNLYSNCLFIYKAYCQAQYESIGDKCKVLSFDAFKAFVCTNMDTEVTTIPNKCQICVEHFTNVLLVTMTKSYVQYTAEEFNRRIKNVLNELLDLSLKPITLIFCLIDGDSKKSITINNVNYYYYSQGQLTVVKDGITTLYKNVIRLEMP